MFDGLPKNPFTSDLGFGNKTKEGNDLYVAFFVGLVLFSLVSFVTSYWDKGKYSYYGDYENAKAECLKYSSAHICYYRLKNLHK